MDKKVFDGGSIGSIINSCKKPVHVVKNTIVSLLSLREKNIVVKNAFTNIVLSRFGIKDSRVYTSLPKVSSKRVLLRGIRGLEKVGLMKVIRSFISMEDRHGYTGILWRNYWVKNYKKTRLYITKMDINWTIDQPTFRY